jgi:hypothetical protein
MSLIAVALGAAKGKPPADGLTYKVGREKRTNHEFTEALERHTRWTTTERDQTPDAIRRLLLQTDPTLAGCGCK